MRREGNARIEVQASLNLHDMLPPVSVLDKNWHWHAPLWFTCVKGDGQHADSAQLRVRRRREAQGPSAEGRRLRIIYAKSRNGALFSCQGVPVQAICPGETSRDRHSPGRSPREINRGNLPSVQRFGSSASRRWGHTGTTIDRYQNLDRLPSRLRKSHCDFRWSMMLEASSTWIFCCLSQFLLRCFRRASLIASVDGADRSPIVGPDQANT